MTNRVEELESRVSALEATVKGLTEELVLTNDRLRELEGEDDLGEKRNRDRQSSRRTGTDGGRSPPRNPDSDLDDIIIA